MSIFTKQVADLTVEDLRELDVEGAQENIRLEFKQEFPSKNEILKKITSMANTYGGFIIIGASEDGKGNLKALDGVPAKRGNKQKFVQWCYENASPPLIPYVKEVPHDKNLQNAFYILFIEESLEAPHFINGRKGCYIRTDEYSQRFEPYLATFDELKFLINRRQQALEFREENIERARSRFERSMKVSSRVNPDLWSRMSLAIIPRFPGSFAQSIPDLQKTILNSQLKASDIEFPGTVLKSAQGSFYHPAPRAQLAPAYFEANVHGMIFYGQGLVDKSNPENPKRIASDKTIGWILFYLRYASYFYKNAGYDGSLSLTIEFDRLEGLEFVLSGSDPAYPQEGKRLKAELDDSIHYVKTTDTRTLQDESEQLLEGLVREILFAFGWAEAFSVPSNVINYQIEIAKNYLMLAES